MLPESHLDPLGAFTAAQQSSDLVLSGSHLFGRAGHAQPSGLPTPTEDTHLISRQQQYRAVVHHNTTHKIVSQIASYTSSADG